MESESAATPYLLHNGELRPGNDPVLLLNDGAISSGAAIFETLAAYDGKPFATEEHLARLRKGAEAFGLALPESEHVESTFAQILESNSLTRGKARLRITITAGTPEGKAQWFVEASPPPPHPPTADVITVPFVRNERGALVGLKTINYGENAVAMKLAHESGATEAIFGNTQDILCEGTWSNVFVCIEGTWLTPTVASGCLPGVTRSMVLRVAADEGNPIAESDISMSELPKVEAAFLTSSLREIQPVSSLDRRILDSDSHPEIAGWQKAFRELVAMATKTSP